MSDKLINVKNTGMKRPSLYAEFIIWSAMPEQERIRLGIETQQQFAKVHNVTEQTLSRWKYRADYEDRVDSILKVWSIGKTPTVIHGMYRSAVKGNPMSQMLWLQYFKKFNPKADAERENKKVETSVNDIRFLIDALPEGLKQKHYGNLQQLIDDSAAIARAIEGGEIPDGVRRAEIITTDESGHEDELSDETDHDAQDVSGTRTNAMATGYPKCVCADVVRQVSENNHKSAARWWKE